ncbi:hypothetical protein [Actinokineospora inagensis]|uniref:hypothetical protein n=1 Tax=Actinokineospora inagensis TaxID=103730 RepID=UPI0005585D8B|nr:hypothetical protein [Actinokineospora inagensis]
MTARTATRRAWPALALLVASCAAPVPGTPVAAPVVPTFTTPAPPTSESAAAPTETSVQTSTEPSETSPAPPTPESVVRAYFDAINAHDYQRAWDLGGKNTGKSFTDFSTGFAGTDHDVLTIQSVTGPTVTIDLVAHQTDGTSRSFHGTYTVTGDTITATQVHATG